MYVPHHPLILILILVGTNHTPQQTNQGSTTPTPQGPTGFHQVLQRVCPPCRERGIELIKGLMDGAAQPGQIPASPETKPDKQQQKIQDIHNEVDHAKREMEITFMKLQERGELMDDLQGKTG
jgi:hypothetical protein